MLGSRESIFDRGILQIAFLSWYIPDAIQVCAVLQNVFILVSTVLTEDQAIYFAGPYS